MEPAMVMGMGARKNTRLTSGFDTELENSAVLQFQELQTAFGQTSGSEVQHAQTAGFGATSHIQDFSRISQPGVNKIMMNGTLISSIGEDLKRSDLETTPPKKHVNAVSPIMDEVLVEDFDGGHTPEF